MANTISFGFASGEASSDFVGAPGQTFYAPVTLSILPATLMYSLQFNVTVTNGGAAPAVTPGAYGFQSMLVKPVVPTPTNYPPGFDLYTAIPPYMFIGNASSPPPPSQIVSYNNGSYVNLEIINTNLNLLGVGWLERYSETNLYNTLSQDLIQYSMAHDDVFSQSAGNMGHRGRLRLPDSGQSPARPAISNPDWPPVRDRRWRWRARLRCLYRRADQWHHWGLVPSMPLRWSPSASANIWLAMPPLPLVQRR